MLFKLNIIIEGIEFLFLQGSNTIIENDLLIIISIAKIFCHSMANFIIHGARQKKLEESYLFFGHVIGRESIYDGCGFSLPFAFAFAFTFDLFNLRLREKVEHSSPSANSNCTQFSAYRHYVFAVAQ